MRSVVYHPKVPDEARALLNEYDSVSPDLGDSFWDELLTAIERARQEPKLHHFDQLGLRRSNLKRFPVHFLFRVSNDFISIIVIRHNRRKPSYGSRRK